MKVNAISMRTILEAEILNPSDEVMNELRTSDPIDLEGFDGHWVATGMDIYAWDGQIRATITFERLVDYDN